MKTVVEKFKGRVRPCPQPSAGVHRWVFHAACVAIEIGLPDAEAVPLIESRMTRAPDPSNEIESALDAARGNAVGGAHTKTTPVWPAPDKARIASIAAGGPGVLSLKESSPWPILGGESRTEEIIDLLFPGDPLLCVGRTKYSFVTMPRSSWRGVLDARQFIVPSPMIAKKGNRKSDGKESFHTLDNTGPRRFLVTEFDSGGLDQHAALLWHLAKLAPLALVIFSGSKSLHGWYPCHDQSEETLLKFMRYATSLGADPPSWGESQFMRMPDGLRSPDKKPALALPKGFPKTQPWRQSVVCLLYTSPSPRD